VVTCRDLLVAAQPQPSASEQVEDIEIEKVEKLVLALGAEASKPRSVQALLALPGQ
jgi:hypothetical protein